ncbi:MAG: TadE/TadG family type IV pilus assembly protein [Janthinobacterium lividum]
MLNLTKKYIRSTKGSVLVEFALIVPVMVLLFVGIFELSNYILLNNKLVRAAGVIGDMITRQNMTRSLLVNNLKTANDVLKPFDFNKYGSIVSTQVQNIGMTTDPTKMIISWQQNYNGGISLLGAIGNIPKNLPGDVSVIKDQTIIVTEIFYQYKPLVFESFFPTKTLYRASVFVPRSGSMNVLIGE